MTVAKKYIQDVVDRMPEELDMEKLMYELYVVDKVMKGRKQVEEGKIVSHDEAKKRLLGV